MNSGWKWSEHRRPDPGKTSCDVEHLGFVVSTRGRGDGRRHDRAARSLGVPFAVPPGHDSWVVGDEPYVSIHLLGASDYAARHDDA
ncbi:MAG: hypothetical protein U0V56_04015 [Actinomycetota bacterium]